MSSIPVVPADDTCDGYYSRSVWGTRITVPERQQETWSSRPHKTNPKLNFGRYSLNNYESIYATTACQGLTGATLEACMKANNLTQAPVQVSEPAPVTAGPGMGVTAEPGSPSPDFAQGVTLPNEPKQEQPKSDSGDGGDGGGKKKDKKKKDDQQQQPADTTTATPAAAGGVGGTVAGTHIYQCLGSIAGTDATRQSGKSSSKRENYGFTCNEVNRETTWVFDAGTGGDWSIKTGSHGSGGDNGFLYELQVTFDGGKVQFRSEGPHPKYGDCTGAKKYTIPAMANKKNVGMKGITWTIGNAVHTEWWWSANGANGPWNKMGELTDNGGACGCPNCKGKTGVQNGQVPSGVAGAHCQDTLRVDKNTGYVLKGATMCKIAPNQSSQGGTVAGSGTPAAPAGDTTTTSTPAAPAAPATPAAPAAPTTSSLAPTGIAGSKGTWVLLLFMFMFMMATRR